MTLDEQNAFLSAEYAEAMRYMDDAKKMLQKAGDWGDGLYKKRKYVKIAGGMAYLAFLLAVDAWLVINGALLPGKKKKMSLDFYEPKVAKIDENMVKYHNNAHCLLYFTCYRGGIQRMTIVDACFDEAYYIIEKIRPENPIDTPETRGDRALRVWNRFVISLSVMLMRKPY